MVNILASLNCSDEVHLLVGVSTSTYPRVQSIIANDAKPILITNKNDTELSSHLQKLVADDELVVLNREVDVSRDLFTLGRSQVGRIVDRVFVNLPGSQASLKQKIFNVCQSNRIPVNTTESPELSTFTVLSTYSDGDFQLGITTSGKGCKLANRIKREIVNKLPQDLGKICDNVGELRLRIQEEDTLELENKYREEFDQLMLGEHEEDSVQSSRFNSFISEYNMSETEKKLQRSRWLNQVVEYYPFSKLASLKIGDLTSQYSSASASTSSAGKQTNPSEEQNSSQSNPNPFNANSNTDPTSTTTTSTTSSETSSNKKKGSISLVGAGPGSLSLLTLGALHEITTADLVLADKLVPQQVIDLIPSKTEKFIARKFPGNAEAAQDELLALGLKALEEGKKVVRLKQGDPYIFGRGGEEVLFFEKHGFEPVVLPGITSALSAAVNSKIPATQRDVADQVLICTGTGRRGVLPNIPEFVKTRTTVFLMSLHRIEDLVNNLLDKSYDPELPACIVERSSCPDQRVTRTKLKYLAEAVEEIGSRPPGLLIVGYACEVLTKPYDDSGKKWFVEEGYQSGDSQINSLLKTIEV